MRTRGGEGPAQRQASGAKAVPLYLKPEHCFNTETKWFIWAGQEWNLFVCIS